MPVPNSDSFLPLLYLLCGLLIVFALVALHDWVRYSARRRRSASTSQKQFTATRLIIEKDKELDDASDISLWDTLTAREKQVAKLAARGLRNTDMARALNITERTVSTHLANIYSKLDVHSKAELANLLRELGVRLT